MLPFDQTPDKGRRNFLRALSALPLAGLALPTQAFSKMAPENLLLEGESYWEWVKRQFTMPSNRIMMNAANLCPSPYFINEQLITLMMELGKDVSFQYRAGLTEKRSEALKRFASFVNVSQKEIGITRNTSEGNCVVVNGLDIKPGEEIVIWDQNHPSNEAAWIKRASRVGFVVKKVSLPVSPTNKDEVISAFAKAITPKTRVLAFSHISNTSGMALPAKDLCALARSKGVLTLVDGAQSLGSLELDLGSMGCDFFTASTHKWLMGSLENGILYAREEHIDRLWPNIVGGGWKDGAHTVDEKICVLGQRNETSPAVLPAIIDFHLSIGKKKVEERVMELSAYLKDQLRQHIPSITFVTPLSPDFSAGIVIINLPGKEPRDVFQKLYANHGIAAAATGGIRLSPHIYNTKADLDAVVNALKTLAA